MNIKWEKLKKETAKRNKEIFQLSKSKKFTLIELGNKYGLTRQRVGKIIKDIKDKRSTIDKK